MEKRELKTGENNDFFLTKRSFYLNCLIQFKFDWELFNIIRIQIMFFNTQNG